MSYFQQKRRAFITQPAVVNGRDFGNVRKCSPRTTRSVTILGGSSGVGLEAAKYLKARGAIVENFSRATGHDFASVSNVKTAVEDASGGVAVCIGAGRRRISVAQEISLYENVAAGLSCASGVTLVVAVVRSLVVPEVRHTFARMLRSPWVLLRPGALVDLPQRGGAGEHIPEESLLVTADVRCNGVVSRRGVGRVVGDVLLRKLPLQDIDAQVFGVYDEHRMIHSPAGSIFIGTHLWRHLKQ